MRAIIIMDISCAVQVLGTRDNHYYYRAQGAIWCKGQFGVRDAFVSGAIFVSGAFLRKGHFCVRGIFV